MARFSASVRSGCDIRPGLFEDEVPGCGAVRAAFDNLDFFNSDDRVHAMSNVIVLGRLDPLSEAETMQRAVAAQARYKFRFDVSQMVAEKRLPAPKGLRVTS